MSASDDTTDAVAELCHAFSRSDSFCAWERGHKGPHAWDCEGLRSRIDDLEALVKTHLAWGHRMKDARDEMQEHARDLEAKLAAVTRERDALLDSQHEEHER